MEKDRLKLQTHLERLLGPEVAVYFQEPPSDKLRYPCVIYHFDGAATRHADNSPYRQTKRYRLTVIDRNPDSRYPDMIASLPQCTFQRWFAKDKLNHNIYQLYY